LLPLPSIVGIARLGDAKPDAGVWRPESPNVLADAAVTVVTNSATTAAMVHALPQACERERARQELDECMADSPPAHR
jgi:hypothetical protein